MENNEQYIVQAIAEIAQKDRSVLVRILNKNGAAVTVKTPDDELFTAVYASLAKSKPFAADLKKAIRDFAGRKQGYSNADASSTLMLGNLSSGSSTSSGDGGRSTTTNTTTQTGGGGGTKSGFGTFLSNIFTPDRIGSILDTGVGALSNKLTSKADQASLQQGIQYQVAQTQAAAQQQKLAEERNKWIIPVIVVTGLVIIGVTAYFVIKKTKK